MNGSVNKVILVGNLGKNPEVRKLESGALLARFSIATSEQYTDKLSGKRIENTDWHDIVTWRGLAEVSEKFLKKGMKVYIEGKLKKRTWTDKDGQQRHNVDIVADELTILSKLEPKQKTKHSYSSENANKITSRIEDIENQPDDSLPF
ncbi:MAG: single-stranded DNA-binding protein [Cryomorphaceae bacterium]|nr:single-stranded DNA-binding protein [Cryomorphaceae bacterium]|tara:strand:- start:2285 stop:2728 length:444 start_codon:yes stop_codon:yes gene_type:complete